MKLFGINLGKGSPQGPSITPTDREWVNLNFQWLLTVLGKPARDQITISEQHFPHVFGTKDIEVENLISDCAFQLGLDRALFSYAIYEDIRDTEGIPYALTGRPQDCELLFDEEKGRYVLVIARDILKHPNWLIATACSQFSKAKLDEKGLKYETASDTDLFLYLAATYLGYGIIIGQNLFDQGRFADSAWETKWAHKADIPAPVLAYALAAFAKLRNDPNPAWKETLPPYLKKEFSASQKLLIGSDDTFDIKQAETISLEELFSEGAEYARSGDFENAISTFQSCINLPATYYTKAIIYNNIGYFKQRLGDHAGSIPHFEKALDYNPNEAYANDNLGLAWIMTGYPDKGFEYLEKAIQTKENDSAYSFRNRAMYFQMKGENSKAEEFFQKAFETGKPVDLLDFFYGRFLISLGDREGGIKHIRRSAALGEAEGIAELQRIL
jgi:tetratricopeptide (TPR) repeat protein